MNFSLLQLNIVSYLLYFASAVLANNYNKNAVHFVNSFFAIIVIFVLGGLNFAALLQILMKRKFSRLEFLNISAAFAIVGVILINYWEILFFRKYDLSIIFLNSALIYLVGYCIAKIPNRRVSNDDGNPVFSLQKKDNGALLFLGLVGLIYASVIGIIVKAYYALPDIDPYSWMLHTQECINSKGIPTCFGERPLYEVMNLLFVRAAEIDLYSYFKYIFPFLSLLIIFPVVLIAQKKHTLNGKLLIALLPLSVPSTLLYLLTPMPQATAIILVFFIFYWLLYSYYSNNQFFFYLAGVMSFFVFWFHQVGIFFFGAWFIVVVFKEKKRIFRFFYTRRVAAVLLFLLLFSNLNRLRQPYEFIANWVNNLSGSFHIKLNLHFPAAYMNIDGSSMGWPGVDGVVKYYLFYAGPVIITMALISLYYLIKNKRSITQVFVRGNVAKEHLIFIILFLLFFSFSDIFPRIFSLAFLPERTWIFAGIIGIFPLIYLVIKRESKFITDLFLVCSFVGIIGGIYVNNQKRFTLPDYRIKAAVWIKNHLPPDRVILSVGDKNNIRVFSQSQYYLMKNGFYCSKDIKRVSDIWPFFRDDQWGQSKKIEDIEKEFGSELTNYLTTAGGEPAISGVQSIVTKYAGQTSSNNIKPNDDYFLQNGYIYYFREDPRNVISNRPYYIKSACDSPVFEKHPEAFSLIYNDNDMVKIWKIVK